jgi:hypothetical protein
LTLLPVEASLALLDRLGDGLDVECVLSDLSGDTWHFCRAPHKYVLVVSEKVNEISFLFGVYAHPNLNSLGGILGVDLHDLGILGHLEGTG